jgi:hypothetical protein
VRPDPSRTLKGIAVAALFTLFTAASANPGPLLRKDALTSPPSEFGATKPHQPFAVIMDVADQKRVVSVLATATGDASLYVTTGGAITGGIRHDSVREAASRFIAEAARHAGLLAKTDKFDYPHKGDVAFFVRTPEATLTATVPEWQLRGGHQPLSPLYAAGQKVITELRRFPMSK